MYKGDLLDPIESNHSSRNSKISFRLLLLTLLLNLLFLALSFFNPGFSFFEYIVLILVLGFIFSNIAGIAYTIKSILNKEPDTIFKILGAVGNIFFFFVMLGMVSFVVMDIVHAF
jgi:hypothetical protein